MAMRMPRRSRSALLGALLLALLAAAGGCALPWGNPATPVTALSILQAASQAQYQDLSFNLTLVLTTGGRTQNGAGNGAMTAHPARTQFTLTLAVPARGATIVSTEDVVTDSESATTYTRTTVNGTTSAWTTQPADVSGSANSTDFTVFANANNLDHPTLVGTETVNGTPSYHLTAAPKPAANSDLPGGSTSLDMWFAKASSRLVKLAVTSLSSDASATLTLTTSGYDTGATIDLPTSNTSATPTPRPNRTPAPGSTATPRATATPRGTAGPTPTATPPTPTPTPTSKPGLKVTPLTRTLSVCIGASTTVTVSNTGIASTTLRWSAAPSDPNYAVTPPSGNLSGGQQVNVTVSNIHASGSVTFSAQQGALFSPQTVTITCTISG